MCFQQKIRALAFLLITNKTCSYLLLSIVIVNATTISRICLHDNDDNDDDGDDNNDDVSLCPAGY